MKIHPLILSFLIIATVGLKSFGQSKATQLDTMINRANRLGLFNGNILVMDGGKIVYKKAIGFTDASKKEKLTMAYRFHIGSIAKEFNAVAIMMLKEQGKLSLDDKVSKFLPELPAWANTISVKNLLQYTSGLPEVNWKDVKGDADALRDLMALTQLNTPPGTVYNYNNNNTFLQRMIVTRLSGMTFNQFVTQKMLKPCGMSASIVDPYDHTPLMAKSYTNEGDQRALIYPITGWTAVTADDFYKWERALETFKLISPASTREIVTPFAPGNQCGLGGGEMQYNKLVFHQHDGITLYYQALLTANPPKGRTVIIMTNNRQNNVYNINDAVQAILDGKPYEELKR